MTMKQRNDRILELQKICEANLIRVKDEYGHVWLKDSSYAGEIDPDMNKGFIGMLNEIGNLMSLNICVMESGSEYLV